MARGRAATNAKDWGAAMRGFDEALGVKKGDARALAERGYARLLEGKDLAGAARDLDEAAALTKDAKLLGPIWFNRGLLDERRKDEQNALVSFQRSNELAPSDAARKKLAGRSACPVRVENGYAPGEGPRLVDGAGWLALMQAMPGLTDDKDAAKSDADARRALTGADKDPTLPTIAIAGRGGTGRTAYVVGRGPKGFRAIAVGAEWGGRCPGELDFSVKETNGDLVLVHGIELVEGGYGWMCMHADAGEIGEMRPCGEMPDDAQRVQSYCSGAGGEIRDLLVDLKTGKVLVSAEQPAGPDVASVSLEIPTSQPGRVRLTGRNCDKLVPFD